MLGLTPMVSTFNGRAAGAPLGLPGGRGALPGGSAANLLRSSRGARQSSPGFSSPTGGPEGGGSHIVDDHNGRQEEAGWLPSSSRPGTVAAMGGISSLLWTDPAKRATGLNYLAVGSGASSSGGEAAAADLPGGMHARSIGVGVLSGIRRMSEGGLPRGGTLSAESSFESSSRGRMGQPSFLSPSTSSGRAGGGVYMDGLGGGTPQTSRFGGQLLPSSYSQPSPPSVGSASGARRIKKGLVRLSIPAMQDCRLPGESSTGSISSAAVDSFVRRARSPSPTSRCKGREDAAEVGQGSPPSMLDSRPGDVVGRPHSRAFVCAAGAAGHWPEHRAGC